MLEMLFSRTFPWIFFHAEVTQEPRTLVTVPEGQGIKCRNEDRVTERWRKMIACGSSPLRRALI